MYKSSNFRNPKAQQDAPADKFGPQIKELQAAFPQWSHDDLQSLLLDVNGDTNAASLRLLEGNAEQWGSVTRKKDKKSALTSSHSRDNLPGRERGDSRGGRGGRAARGGPRGGAARGASVRGAHHEVNGHRAKPSQAPHIPKDSTEADPLPAAPKEPAEVDAESSSAWTSSTPANWGGDTADINGSASHTNPGPVPAPIIHVPASAPLPKVVSNPATSKLSWAQIARKQEKPAPPPAPAVQSSPTPPVHIPTPPPAEYISQSQPVSPREEAVGPASTGWEEPTTVQAPTWDDEPRPLQQTEPTSASVAEDELIIAQSEPESAEEVPEHVPSVVPLGVVQQAISEGEAVPVKPLTPSISTRPTSVSHRAPKYKTSDQPVVLPASFGSGIEKIGMQFGSLNLGGDDFDAPTYTHDIAPVDQKIVQPTASEPVSASAPAVVSQPQEPAVPITSPPSQMPTSASLFQSSISQSSQQHSQQTTHVPTVSQPQQSTFPTSLSQPAISTQSSIPASSAPSISQYSQPQQQPLSHQAQQQSQSQAHHPYGQHGLSTHLDLPSQPQHHGQGQASGGYIRQSDQYNSPYIGGAYGQPQVQNSHFPDSYHEDQRNCYDPYPSGPTSFGNRSVLGPDETKSLPGTQQPHGAPGGLPPSAAPASQQHPSSSQGGSQGPTPNQGPGYYYPFYTTPPQSSFFPPPFPYPHQAVPQPPQQYMKYLASNSGPGPQPSKGPAPPFYSQAAEPFGGGDIGAGVGSGGLPSNDYGKPINLYGNVPFMLAQSGAGPTSGPNQRNAAGSPENAFKPYGPKDVVVGSVGQASAGQVPQGRGAIQYQQTGQAYSYGQRFQNQPQGQQPQQPQQAPLGYSQVGQDWSFYAFPQRQQQF